MSSSELSSHTHTPILSSPVFTPDSLPSEPVPSVPVFECRKARPFPPELQQQCQVYFEEHIFANGLDLLDALLVAGVSDTSQTTNYAPPPNHIALLATLSVHPTYTTRASAEHALVSNRSTIVLRNILKILGPINAQLATAFSFQVASRNNRRGRAQSDSDEEFDDNAIDSSLAREHSLWTQIDSFWDIVGWAFNCSVKYKLRWEHWRAWLEYMVDVLDADWDERVRLDQMSDSPSQETSHLQKCMLLQYLRLGGRTHTFRRIVKSIFADGSTDSLKAFQEVWSRETLLSNDNNKRKRADTVVDIDNDKFGEYSEDDELSGPASPDAIRIDDTTPIGPIKPADMLGGPHAIALRLRLLALLSRASHFLSDTSESVPSIPDLYNLIYESLRPQPLPAFSLFLTPTALHHGVPASMLVSLTQLMLVRLMPASAPNNSQDDDDLNQDVLQRCYLPFAASSSSIEDNAKVAVCVETLLRVYVTSGGPIVDIEALSKSIEKGIAAREKKATPSTGGPGRKRGAKGTNSGVSNEKADLEAMQMSAERLRVLVEVLRMKVGSGAA